MASYPIELNLRGRAALVVGLGAVGRRKASGLAEAGARVVGVDPAWTGPETLAAGGTAEAVEVRREAYHEGHLSGMSLAVAAASAEVNRRVVADARRLGVWVCSASDPEDGDFTVPASWTSGALRLTVSTSGASPALAAMLRDRAAAALGPAAAGLAALFAELRPAVKARVADPAVRRRIFTEWADPRWLELCEREGLDAVREALARRIDEGVNG